MVVEHKYFLVQHFNEELLDDKLIARGLLTKSGTRGTTSLGLDRKEQGCPP
jgi:hypothetical protein